MSTPPEAPASTPNRLATGPVFSQQWASLGGYTGTLPGSPLSKVKGAIVGPPNSGKSHLIQSCPSSYILNFDTASAVGPATKALMWPARDNLGQVLGDGGQPITPSFKPFRDKILKLLELAKTNQPRPATIFMDSFSSALRMIKEDLQEDNKVTEWRDLTKVMDGRTAWDTVHERMIWIGEALHRAGYGFFYLMHVTNAKIQVGENRTVFMPELAGITENFWSKFQYGLEFVGVVRSTIEDVPKTIDIPVNFKDSTGATITRSEKRAITSKERRWFLSVNDPDFVGITRARVKKALPDKIYLPETNPWEYLENTYSQHT